MEFFDLHLYLHICRYTHRDYCAGIRPSDIYTSKSLLWLIAQKCSTEDRNLMLKELFDISGTVLISFHADIQDKKISHARVCT